ncbi:hypothetical protein [Sphingobium sp.]|uniref:hypothetical protein n=1 Tax=Sphingobium sp. TaxID=1912891 RepID=UPI003B3BD918
MAAFYGSPAPAKAEIQGNIAPDGPQIRAFAEAQPTILARHLPNTGQIAKKHICTSY